MTQRASALPAWDERDLTALLTLEPRGAGRWRTRFGDANLNGRSYGGQALGQAMRALAMEVPPDRPATMLQFLFLQGSMPDQPIDFEVATLQDGRRFSSRHVRGTQNDGRALVVDAHATFAAALPAPSHEVPSGATENDPEALPTLDDLPAEWGECLRDFGAYSLVQKPSLDFRVPQPEQQLAQSQSDARLRFWLRARGPFGDNPGLHAAAFAYLSDWWLNFATLAPHMDGSAAGRRIYVSSLNHSIWFHRPPVADRWMHFDVHSPGGLDGRGLVISRAHDRAGRLVASATQECLMAYL